MTLTPLAERIYRALIQRVKQPNPLISYGDLVRSIGPLPHPNEDLKPNDERLFAALSEIATACQSRKPPLPILTAIVVRRAEDGSLGAPGVGYFALTCPEIRDETRKLAKWREEVKRASSFPYPDELTPPERSRRTEPRIETTRPAAPQLRMPQPAGLRTARRWIREPTVIAAVIGLVGTLMTALVTVWVSGRRDEPAPPNQADRPIVNAIVNSQSVKVNPREEKLASANLTLDGILEVLERHRQRATFGAVAAILDRDTRSLFSGYTRTPRTAWVVNKGTGLPTGTKADGYPPGLLENKRVIDTAEELRVWLRDHR
jgi:hypothetical protein